IRKKTAELKKHEKTIALVPTMGAFHEGHLSLIRLAHQHADEVIVSIYVNPEQFGPDEDYDEYPRRLEADLARCKDEGVTAVFAPSDEVMYPSQKLLRIEVDKLNNYMDG